MYSYWESLFLFTLCTILLENAKAVLSKPLPPAIGVECERFEGYWLKKGMVKPIRDENYILTDTVKANMKDVARVVSCG